MSLPNLDGPHALSQRIIEQTIRRKVAGIYALSAKEGGVIALRRIGRADADLAAALLEFLGVYSHFSFAVAETIERAYEMECRLFHALAPPENAAHPVSPSGSASLCPVCGR